MKSGRIAFPLPAGLPSESWLWLKEGTEWLDSTLYIAGAATGARISKSSCPAKGQAPSRRQVDIGAGTTFPGSDRKATRGAQNIV